jgi:hypothetical protein
MSSLKDISDATKVLMSFVLLIVVVLIVYGVIKILHVGGNTGENVGKTAENVSSVASDASGAAADITKDAAGLFTHGSLPPGTPGAWNKLVALGGGNPLIPSTWTGPRSDSTSAAAIAGFISNLNNLPGNHWYDVFKLGEDLNDLLGNAPAEVVGVFAAMPSQCDIYQAVAGYNAQYSDDIYSGIISSLDSNTQDSLATIIMAKPLTV